ncbi:MAG: ABC transporter ATP-binding protein [Hyphomicrobiales bacterium]|nr:ABC transporter ATP-binding protein [Hyphomicrobiales bacterium]
MALTPILVADDLHRFHHVDDAEVRALRGASLTIGPGETVALVGPSGSGKSTFLACVAGLDDPDGGSVDVAGERMSRRPQSERAALRARVVGYLAQSGNLLAQYTVAENVALQLRLRGKRDVRNAVATALADVGMTARADARPSTLSGGEAARAGLAVALAGDPPLIVADEPTAEVDAATEALVLATLDRHRSRGRAILVATHSGAVAGAATRVARIRDGRIEAGLGDAEAAASVAYGPRATPAAGGATIVRAAGLRKAFGPRGAASLAVADAGFEIRVGDRIALVGPSGGGKSTLLNLIAGLEDASEGLLDRPGLDGTLPLRPRQIGFAFQAPSLVPTLNVAENMDLPVELGGIPTRGALPAVDLLALFGVDDLLDKLPDRMSGGQMQRVALARALVPRPTLLLADEPTGQLDRATGERTIDALLRTLDGWPCALVVATHDPAVAARMSRVWRMDAGRLTELPQGQ